MYWISNFSPKQTGAQENWSTEIQAFLVHVGSVTLSLSPPGDSPIFFYRLVSRGKHVRGGPKGRSSALNNEKKMSYKYYMGLNKSGIRRFLYWVKGKTNICWINEVDPAHKSTCTAYAQERSFPPPQVAPTIIVKCQAQRSWGISI